MNPVVLAAAIQAGSSLMTNISNVALSERQRNTSVEMQDKMNQYNSPEEQVKRMKAAGLNPNLSNGQVIGANQSAPFQGYQLPQLRDLMTDASNSALTLAQAKTDEAMRSVRIEEAQANIDNLKANAIKLGLESDYQNIINGYAAAQQEQALVEGRSRIHLNWMQSRKINYECRELGYRIAKILPQDLAESISREKLNLAQLPEILARIANYQANTDLTKEQRNTEELNQAQIQENITLTQENIEGKQIENKNAPQIADLVMKEYQATINKLVSEGDLTQQEAYYYLFDLSKKHAVRFFGIPLMGAGGIKDMLSTGDVQSQARQKYGQ